MGVVFNTHGCSLQTHFLPMSALSLSAPLLRRIWRSVYRPLGWLVLCLALLCLSMWGVVRLWGNAWVAGTLERALGRTVAVQSVDWRPWSLRGEVRGLEVAGRRPDQQLLKVERISVDVAAESLWRARVVVRELQVDGPQLTLSRVAAGHYDVDDVMALASQPSSGKPMPWSLHNIHVAKGSIDFHDEPLGTTQQVRALKLDLPFLSSQPSDVAVVTTPHLSFELNGDAIDLQAESTPFAQNRHTHLQLQVPHLDLRAYRAYWPAALPVRPEAGVAQLQLALEFEQAPTPRVKLKGALAIQDAHWRATDGTWPLSELRWSSLALQLDESDPVAGQWSVPEVRLQGARVWNGPLLAASASPMVAVQQVTVKGLQADTARQSVRVASLDVQAPDVRLGRNAQGHWSWAPQALGVDRRPTQAAMPAPAGATPVPPAWSWSLGTLTTREGHLAWLDEAVARPVSLQVSQWTLQADGLDSAYSAPIPLQLAWQWDSAPSKGRQQTPDGRFNYKGTVSVAPDGGRMGLQGQLSVQQLPLHALAPYADRWLQAQLLRGWLQYQGQLDLAWLPAGPQAQLAGDLGLSGVRLRMPGADDDVLRWDALQLRGLGVQVVQGQLRQLTVAETSLVDYAMRAQLDPQGHLNLLDLVRRDGGASVAPSSVAAAASSPPVAAVQTVPAQHAPMIRLGPMSLVQGKVFFNDQFVKPRYSVTVSELTGAVGAFSNQGSPDGSPPPPADVLLRGRAEGSADLEIRGQVQPLARPLVLALQAQLHGLDLSPMTGYSSRFTGYGIERGKLSLEARYQLDGQGVLQARNRIVLDQLTFGERQDGEGVPNWPVKLAVSLLADRNGVVDIQLPIQGSINDPQFSVGSIVVRLLFNLVAKAVTSPLSLIAAAFGHGDEFTQVPFEPGHADMAASAQASVDKLAGWMRERGHWVLTVQGQADAAQEQAAYRREQLRQMVQAQKNRQSAGAEGAVTEQEWPGWLLQVYQRAKISKPRNLIGMARELSVPDMESLLLASIPVDEAAMQALAQARARAVRDALVAQGISADQIFMAPPKTAATTTDWSPRAQLQLQAR